MSLFATKPLETADAAQPLRRVLGAVDLTLLGIGAIIGTGIFVLTGQAAAAHSGPAVASARWPVSHTSTGRTCWPGHRRCSTRW